VVRQKEVTKRESGRKRPNQERVFVGQAATKADMKYDAFKDDIGERSQATYRIQGAQKQERRATCYVLPKGEVKKPNQAAVAPPSLSEQVEGQRFR